MLFVDDAVETYMRAAGQIGRVAGRAFNLGGGPDNAVTLLDVLGAIAQVTGRQPDVEFQPWRPGDQRYFVADARLVRRELGLAAPLGWRAGLARLADWLATQRNGQAQAAGA